MKLKTFTLVLLGFLLCENSFSQIVITSQSSNDSCYGQCDGSIKITVAGGVLPYTYSWSNGSTNQNLSGLCDGFYYLTVTDSSSNTATKTIYVSPPIPELTTTILSTNPNCNGGTNGTATITTSGGITPYSYVWSTIPTQITSNSTGLSSGVFYVVTVTDSRDCKRIRYLTLSQPTAITATMSFTAPSCNGGTNGTATVTASGGTPGYTYSWTTAPSQTTSSATGYTSGSYTVMVTDSKSCTRTNSVTLTQPSAMILTTSSTDATCGNADGTATVSLTSGGTSPFMYSWSTGNIQPTNNSTGLSSGIYSVTVIDSESCTQSASVSIGNLNGPTITSVTGTNPTCNGGTNGSAIVSGVGGANPPFTYSWTTAPAQTSSVGTGLLASSYTVTVTDSKGCNAVANVTLSQPSKLFLNISPVSVSCDSCFDGSATLTVSGGTPPYQYQWFDGSQNSTHLNLGKGTYCVTVIDANQCTDSSCVTINYVGGTCTSYFYVEMNWDSVNFFDYSSGGTAPFSYLWDFGDGSTSNLQYPTHIYQNTGSFNVCFTISDSLSCTDTYCDSITALGSGGTCSAFYYSGINGNIVNLYGVGSGGTAPYSYLWDFGDSSQSNLQNPSHTFINNGQYNVCLTITDAVGCVKQYCKTLTISCMTNFVYSQINSCKYIFNSSSSTGNIITWNWNFGDGTTSTEQNPVHSYTNSGFYLIKLTTITSDSCSKTTQKYVSVSGCTGVDNGCIYGCVYQDDNLNCIKDPSEPGQTNWLLQLFDMNNVIVSFTKPGSGGCFYFSNVNPGNYIVRADPFYNWWQWDVSCPSNPDYIEVSVDSGTCDTISFGVGAPLNTIGKDLAVAVDPLGAARPGGTLYFTIGVCNKGSEIQSGKLTFIMNPNFNDTWNSPTPNINIADTLVWNFSNLNPGNCFVAYSNLNISTSTTMGQILGYKAIAEPISGDVTPDNNIDTSYVVISSSYDPNDKLVTPKGTYPDGAILPSTKEFIYTIRFQNTGNDTAFNIYIIDTLDLKVFDFSSFKILNSSHPYEVEFPGTGVVSFHFPNVLLPDSNRNERGSHGFIQYIISRKEGLVSKTAVKNKADIYFDYNPPVPTPWVINILDSALITQISKPKSSEVGISIIPNPFTGNAMVKIYHKTPSFTNEKLNFKLVDLLGKEKLSGVFENDQYEIKDRYLSGGIYFYQVLHGKEMLNAGKVVVMKK